MKKILSIGTLALATILCLPTVSFADVYIKYYNKDSQKHVMKVQMNGLTKEVTFNGSTTSAATIQGSGTTSNIETLCGKVEVKHESKIEIKNGCFKFI